MSDYGSGAATDLAVGVYALRTFAVADGKLSSVIQGAGHWDDGVCEARCVKDPTHEAPADGCKCGIYGTHTLEALFSRYPEHSSRIVAVIAPEGRTVTGPKGLRTAFARIVAYWCAEPAGRLPRRTYALNSAPVRAGSTTSTSWRGCTD
jgi:hypothetical protein